MSEPRFPDYPPPLVDPGRRTATRASRRQINELATEAAARQATVAASGSLHRIIYGRDRIGGRIFAWGKDDGDLVVGVEWGHGEIEEVEKVFINGADIPGSVAQIHYVGTTTQPPDSHLVAAKLGYNDSLVRQTPFGPFGIAYTVLRIPPGAIDGWPRVEGILKGEKSF